ncbi:MAG TPA: hypothetical protein VK002_00995, partial [Rubricoccaceae bacterium]|nr:hypothetical protein [Rubricoccaceae bacterium]
GVGRVPALYEEVRAGAVETFGAGRSEVLGAPPEADGTQRPSLFDFTRGRGAPVLVGSASEQ